MIWLGIVAAFIVGMAVGALITAYCLLDLTMRIADARDCN